MKKDDWLLSMINKNSSGSRINYQAAAMAPWDRSRSGIRFGLFSLRVVALLGALAAGSAALLRADSLTNPRVAPTVTINVGPVYVNDDDANNNQAWDKDDTGPVSDGDPAMSVGSYTITPSTAANAYTGGQSITVTAPGGVALWTDSTKAQAYALTDGGSPFYIEGLTPTGTARGATFTVTWTATDPEADGSYISNYATLKTGIWQVDLDVDSDNNGTIDDVDDKIEASSKPEHPGKIVVVNTNFASGLGIAGAPAASAPVLVSMLARLPQPFEKGSGSNKAKFMFAYDASVPRLETDNSGDIHKETGGNGSVVFSLNKGGIRLWKSTGRNPKNVENGGDFIQPNTWLDTQYLPDTVYVEYVDKNPAAAAGKHEITLSAKQDVPVDNSDPLVSQLAYTAMTSDKVIVKLVPLQVKVVDRNDPKKTWGDVADHLLSNPIYAGESGGDMVSWKLAGADTLTNVTFTWTAEGPSGETVTGPTGAGKNEWTINDADEDTVINWLKWKPGKWKIKVQIGSGQVEFEQEVGWRTEDYVVIGQIIETHTHDGDAPALVEVGDHFWEISSPVALYRRAVLYDMLDLPFFDSLADDVRNALTVTPLSITQVLTKFWFGYWSLIPEGLTREGPFVNAYPSGNGNVGYGHRFWALQSVLNAGPDTPTAPTSFSPEQFDGIKGDEKYRIFQRYKTRFLVTGDGKIKTGSSVPIHREAKTGPTKVIHIPANVLSPLYDTPAYDLLTFPSDTNGFNDNETLAQDSAKLSYYATGRVGSEGQKVNWRLMGKDAPWIFSEIIIELKPDRAVTALYKTSVDTSWSEAGGLQGQTQFNNLNLYKALVEKRSDGTFKVTYTRQKLLPMEGKLEGFINSASGQRHEPPIPPSVQ